MNIPHIIYTIVLISAFSIRVANGAPENQTTSPIPGARPSPGWNWGLPTNGICGEAEVLWDNGGDESPVIAVSVVNTNINGFLGEPTPKNSHEIAPILQKMFSGTMLFFAPTNQFCGPVELENTNGMKIPPLKPQISSRNSYPAFFSLSAVTKSKHNPLNFFPRPLGSWRDSLARFPLDDYFDIKKPGTYQLTVWPKIYKRASTNDDICHRIDLPPVSVTIKWNGTPQRK